MQGLTLLIFPILASSVYSFGEKFVEDKKHFNAFLKEVYGTDYQIESFIDLIWPKIQQAVPGSVDLPGIEVFDPVSDFYMCATTTTIHPKIGEILGKRLMIKTREKITYEVEAELLLDSKPVDLSLSKPVEMGNTKEAKPSPLVHVSYLFKEPSKIKFILEIRNVFISQDILPPSCLLRIKALMVDWVSQPEVLSKHDQDSSKTVEEHFRNNFRCEGSKITGTIGLVKAVNESLNAKTNFWVCSSRAFDHVAKVTKKKWEHTENYNKFCLGK